MHPHEISKRCAVLGLVFSPTRILIDFEKAAFVAILENFPNCVVSFCRFHLDQSLFRKISSLGLREHYIKHDEIGKWLSRFFGLSFLPANIKLRQDFNVVPRQSKPQLLNEKYLSDAATKFTAGLTSREKYILVLGNRFKAIF